MRKIKWGVLGTAGIAKGQTIPGMKEANNCELYAIAGRNMEKAKEYCKQVREDLTYSDTCVFEEDWKQEMETLLQMFRQAE